ncbi:hypothetical protein [Winogradskyella jejuensis]|uniref:Uncharacterized protein n=1 Tax=Winogradskyella jejuensis TaxID=1089305 RepID=A0A1M5LZR7_9FLAO|nr:hypothetical protein [Winogradskyella jejuensis]SHG70179.1 hypothetical protein SAMN05444148_0756 [Winogradskyella jejuensis]
MKIKSIFALLIFAVLSISCASDQEQEAFAHIGNYYNAEVNFTKGFSSKVGKETENYIALKIKNSPYEKRIKEDQLSVYAATLLLENLNDEEIDKYTHIKVNFFHETDSEEKADSLISYKIETIKNVSRKSQVFKNTVNALLNASGVDVFRMLDEKYRDPKREQGFAEAINSMKIERNGVKAIKLLGVEALVDKTTRERYLGYNGEIAWGNNTNSYLSVRTFEDPKNDDIIFLNLN